MGWAAADAASRKRAKKVRITPPFSHQARFVDVQPRFRLNGPFSTNGVNAIRRTRNICFTVGITLPVPHSHPQLLLIDDHTGILEMVTTLLQDRFEVVAKQDALDIVNDFERINPAIVALDVEMPRLGRLAAARLLKSRHPDARIEFLTGDISTETTTAAKDAGGCGLMMKVFAADFLIPALESVLSSTSPDWAGPPEPESEKRSRGA